MESRKMVLMNLQGSNGDADIENRLMGPGRGEEGESGTNGDRSIGTFILPYVKQLASGNLLNDSGNSN